MRFVDWPSSEVVRIAGVLDQQWPCIAAAFHCTKLQSKWCGTDAMEEGKCAAAPLLFLGGWGVLLVVVVAMVTRITRIHTIYNWIGFNVIRTGSRWSWP